MAEVFGLRSLVYWWGVFTATVFIKDWLLQLAAFLLDPKSFSKDKFPFNMLPGLNSWIDGAANYIRDHIQFEPAQVIAGSGALTIYGWMLATAVGLILIGIALALYIRALNTSTWLDDFLALGVVYVVLRIEGHIVSLAALPIQNWFRNLVDQPGTAFLIMMTLLLFLVFFGEGFRSKRAFWRGLLEGGLVALFMFPSETAVVLGYVVRALAQFGASLNLPANAPFAIVWGLVGMALAFQRLTTQEAAGSAGGH
jgi:hypothetical protein